MKYFIYIAFFHFLLFGCVTNQYLHYKSEATLDHIRFTKYSSLHLVDADEIVKSKLTFDKRILTVGVYAGIDLPNTKYILLAPGRTLDGTNTFDNYFLHYPVFIKEDDLKEFVFFVNKIIENWDVTIPINDGQFYNFSIAPVKSVSRVDSSNVQFYTTFQINFQRTTNGNIVMLSFSNDNFQDRMELKDKASLEVFLSKILNAKQYLSIE